MFISFHNASLWGHPDFSLEWVNMISSETLSLFYSTDCELYKYFLCFTLLLKSLELDLQAIPDKGITSSQHICYVILILYFTFFLLPLCSICPPFCYIHFVWLHLVLKLEQKGIYNKHIKHKKMGVSLP